MSSAFLHVCGNDTLRLFHSYVFHHQRIHQLRRVCFAATAVACRRVRYFTAKLTQSLGRVQPKTALRGSCIGTAQGAALAYLIQVTLSDTNLFQLHLFGYLIQWRE